ERLVEPQLRGHELQAATRRLVTSALCARRVARPDEEDDERDERDHQEEQDRPQNSPDEISEHVAPPSAPSRDPTSAVSRDVRRRSRPAPHELSLCYLSEPPTSVPERGCSSPGRSPGTRGSWGSRDWRRSSGCCTSAPRPSVQ